MFICPPMLLMHDPVMKLRESHFFFNFPGSVNQSSSPLSKCHAQASSSHTWVFKASCWPSHQSASPSLCFLPLIEKNELPQTPTSLSKTCKSVQNPFECCDTPYFHLTSIFLVLATNTLPRSSKHTYCSLQGAFVQIYHALSLSLFLFLNVFNLHSMCTFYYKPFQILLESKII